MSETDNSAEGADVTADVEQSELDAELDDIDAEQRDLDAEADDLDAEQDDLDAEGDAQLDDAQLDDGENDDVAGDGDTAQDVEVLDESGEPVEPAQPARNGLDTYTMTEGPFKLKIIPRSQQNGLAWYLVIYMSGTQGPVLETASGIDQDQADSIGLSESSRREANRLLSEARDRLDLPAGFESETSKKSFSDLENVLDGK